MGRALRWETGLSKLGRSQGNMNEKSKDVKVIQCPSCQTKFAVPRATIEASAFPRFHCSRCDHVFAIPLEQMPLNLGGQPVSDPVREEYSDPKFSGDAFPEENVEDTLAFNFSENESTNETSASPTSGWTLGLPGSENTEKPSDDQEEVTDTLGFKQSPADSDPYAQYQFDPGADADEQPGLPLNPRALKQKQARASFSGFELPTAEVAGTSNKASTTEQTAGTSKAIENIYPDGATSTIANISPAALIATSKDRLAGWKQLAYIALPVLICLVLLVLLGSVLTSNPGQSVSIANSIIPGQAQVAPASLYISKVRHQVVELESGDAVHIISGTLKNSSEDTFSEVILQGFAYNEAGRELESLLVSAASSLAKTRIQSLSLEMIDNLQNKPINKRYQLKAGESQDFTIAMFSEALEKTTYYSARVYSVRK